VTTSLEKIEKVMELESGQGKVRKLGKNHEMVRVICQSWETALGNLHYLDLLSILLVSVGI